MNTFIDPLIIIGAGPKAMAIAAKSVVLKKLGFSVPHIHIIEKVKVGAHWKGDAGFTNGRMELGTSPEKDVGFPYQSSFGIPELDKKINLEMWKFSWSAFLIAQGEFASWVDQGKPAPTHGKWADYLNFVAEQLSDGVTLTLGDVTSLGLDGSRWKVNYIDSLKQLHTIYGQGVVVTGPGKTKQSLLIDQEVHEQVYPLETFWKKIGLRELGEMQRVAVIGAGENAASAILALIEAYGKKLKIDVISPFGSLFTRGESYYENRVYSNPLEGKWSRLSLEDRRAFIRRTDLGVFSVNAMKILNDQPNLSILPGRAVKAQKILNSSEVGLAVSYGGEIEVYSYDNVIMATGFDQVAFVDQLLEAPARARIIESGLTEFNADCVSLLIEPDLSLKGLEPKLHLPMIAGISQGPGFANLSSLGRLADQILSGYTHSSKRLNHAFV